MTYDYKRLCNELLSHLYQCDWPDGERFYALVERTRIALAEPEPPSLKEQALQALGHLDKGAEPQMDTTEAVDTIRRALKSLPD